MLGEMNSNPVRLAGIHPKSYLMLNTRLNEVLPDAIKVGTVKVGLDAKKKHTITVHTEYVNHYERDNDFTSFDRSVMDAVATLYEYGEPTHIITPAMVYRVISGSWRKPPTKHQADSICRSLEKLSALHIHIDARHAVQAFPKAFREDDCQFDDLALNLQKVTLQASATAVAYEIQTRPILLEFASRLHQIIYVSSKTLAITASQKPLSITEQRLVIRDYLIRRIQIMKHSYTSHGKRYQSNRILLSSLQMKTGLTDISAVQMQRYRDYMKQIFDYWISVGYIKNYSIVHSGNHIIAFDLMR